MTNQWLMTQRANRFFLVASLINIAFLAGVAFVVVADAIWKLDTMQNPVVRNLLGCWGGLTAVAAIALIDGTRKYWRELDDSASSRKRFWYWILMLGVNFGSCAYYFLVYRPRLREMAKDEGD